MAQLKLEASVERIKVTERYNTPGITCGNLHFTYVKYVNVSYLTGGLHCFIRIGCE